MLAGADGIVLSTPVFAAAPCARMKNFIDRLGLFEYMTGTIYGGKYFAAIATEDRRPTSPGFCCGRDGWAKRWSQTGSMVREAGCGTR